MREERLSFFSGGDRVSGLLRRPDAAEGPHPGIVHGPGFGGTKDSGLYERVHASLADAGYASFVFDYRGFGGSGGDRRLLPYRQVRTIRDGLSALAAREDVDGTRLGAFGHGGTGGGNAVVAAALDDRIRAVVSSLGIDDGAAWLRSMRGGPEWRDLIDRVRADENRRVETGEGETARLIGGILPSIPEREARLGDPPTRRVPLADVRELLAYRPIDVVDRIAPRAALFVSVDGDELTPAAASRRLYEAARSPAKLVTVEGTDHYAAYDDRFDVIVAHVIGWFDRHLDAADALVEEKGP